MNRLSQFFLLFLFPWHSLRAQTSEGVVLDNETMQPVPGVVIMNQGNGIVVLTDTAGHFNIKASGGDTLLFRHTSYIAQLKYVAFSLNRSEMTILLMPAVISMKETNVVGLSKYQKDSVARHDLYSKELQPPALKTPKSGGLGCDGCVGWIADKLTGNGKRRKKFGKDFQKDDEEKFIDSRYTLALVADLTGLKDTDKMAQFMHAYPMAYSFAHEATDLELKAWIRNNYREYCELNKHPAQDSAKIRN
jgi:hypothetical protein